MAVTPSDPPVSFAVSYDRTTKVISAAVVLVLLTAAILSRNLLIGGLATLTVVLAYAYSPAGYTIAGGAIVVRRLLRNVLVPLEGLREARRAAPDDYRGCLRLWGSGGLFGYYGLFRTSKFGRCTWYVTNRANAVVVITSAKTVLFSPDDVDGFLSAIPGGRTSDVRAAGESSGGAGRLIARLVVPAIVLAAVLLVAAALFYSPGPPRYSLNDDALSIHDLLYRVTLRAADIHVEGIRVIDLKVDREWRPEARTNGFANSHYQSGWFRVSSGAKVRLYRAGSDRLVLLPPKAGGAPVLLEVEDPEAFVQTLHKKWSERR